MIMEERQKELSELKMFTEKLDNDTTMILQSLQWDRRSLEEAPGYMITCKHNPSHRIPPQKKDIHEQECFLVCHGYDKGDLLLPDPVDPTATTVVTLNNATISKIIDESSKLDPLFKKVGMNVINMILKTSICSGALGPQPLSLERLQATYSTDERRAIHDAVVQAVPFCHDLADLALPSNEAQKNSTNKSRLEILAELRDMKRRRTKYRVAAKTRNYSDVLRDVIKTQMEMYAEVKSTHVCKQYKVDHTSNSDKDATFAMNNRKYCDNYKDRSRGSSITSTSNRRPINYGIVDRERLREETPLLDEPKLKDKMLEEYRRRYNDVKREKTKDRYTGRRSRSREDKYRHRYKEERTGSYSQSRTYNDKGYDTQYINERSDKSYKKYNEHSSSRDRDKCRHGNKYREPYNLSKDVKHERCDRDKEGNRKR